MRDMHPAAVRLPRSVELQYDLVERQLHVHDLLREQPVVEAVELDVRRLPRHVLRRLAATDGGVGLGASVGAVHTHRLAHRVPKGLQDILGERPQVLDDCWGGRVVKSFSRRSLAAREFDEAEVLGQLHGRKPLRRPEPGEVDAVAQYGAACIAETLLRVADTIGAGLRRAVGEADKHAGT